MTVTPRPDTLRRNQSTAAGSRSTAYTVDRRILGGHRCGDRAGPGAQIDHGGRIGKALRVGPQPAQSPLDQKLGLGPGHERPRTDRQLQMPERRHSGEVLQWHPIRSGPYQVAEAPLLRRGKAVDEREPAARHPEHVGGEQFRVHARRRNSGGRQLIRRLNHGVRYPHASNSGARLLARDPGPGGQRSAM